MSDNNKECIIISVAVIMAILIVMGGLVYNGKHRRNKVQECINQTNDELKCRCVYYSCSEKILETVN